MYKNTPCFTTLLYTYVTPYCLSLLIVWVVDFMNSKQRGQIYVKTWETGCRGVRRVRGSEIIEGKMRNEDI